MASVNNHIILGRLGKDPEIRHTTTGKSVCSFSVATSEQWTDNQGQKQEHTEWHNVVCWDRVAENCAKYLAKGREVYVEGPTRTRSYDGNDGTKRYVTELIASRVQFIGSAPSGAHSGQGDAIEEF